MRNPQKIGNVKSFQDFSQTEVDLRPRGKGRKQAGGVKGGGRCDERGVIVCVWGIERYKVESESDDDADDADGDDADDAADADDADGKDLATMSTQGIEPRQNCLWKSQPGGVVDSELHEIGNSGPFQYLATARGTSASRS